jgi:hypothetical protein
MIGLNLLWTVYLLHDMRIILNPQQSAFNILHPGGDATEYHKETNVIETIFVVTFSSLIGLSGLNYMTDKYYRKISKTKFLTYFGIIEDYVRDYHEVQNTYVVSNLSVELLYVILQSITKFSTHSHNTTTTPKDEPISSKVSSAFSSLHTSMK